MMYDMVYFDVWGTLIQTRNAQTCSQILEGIIVQTPYEKSEFFGEWKNHWFKQESTYDAFVHHLLGKMPLLQPHRDELMRVLVLHAQGGYAFPETEEVLSKLRAQGVPLGIISDAGSDTLTLLERLDLLKMIDDPVFSFQQGTVKKDGLYAIVRERSPGRLLMVGDDPLRDRDIPLLYGFTTVLVDRNDPSSPNAVADLRGVLEVVRRG